MTNAWVARYSGPSATTWPDTAVAVKTDTAGNVYVTGYSTGNYTGYDYATLKYDSDGHQLWVARYDAEGLDDQPVGLAVDDAGNVYVTGTCSLMVGGSDYTTVKYDAQGNQLWAVRYNGTAGSLDHATGIALDRTGNVYVTGYSRGDWGFDYTTIKYDSSGNQLWVARYDNGNNDYATALAVDSAGNAYVTGYSSALGAGYDYATVKYDAAGNQLWVTRYNGPGNGSDMARAIAIDPAGNVYVTGSSLVVGTNYDYATLKYDNSGNQLWVARYSGPGNGANGAAAIAVAPSGDVYVTGSSTGSGTDYDYATVKYDPDGNQLWVARYGSANVDDHATALAVDATGNAYVTGYFTYVGYDYMTLKYDKDGNPLWLMRYNTPTYGEDKANALALDAAGNVYVTGSSVGNGTGQDFLTIKYAPISTVPPPQITSVTRLPDGNLRFTLVGVSNVVWRLEAAITLSSPSDWSTLRNLTSATGTFQFTDLNATNFPQRFYRVVWP